jgi:tetratricopeptide (TPR) repeat protein
MKRIAVLVPVLFMQLTMPGQNAYDVLLEANAYIASGKPSMAIGLLSSALVKYDDSRLYISRAEAYLIAGDADTAIRDFNSADRLTRFSGEYGLAKAYAMKGDAATSLSHLEINLRSPFRKSEKEVMMEPVFQRIENRPEWRLFWKNEWYTAPEKALSETDYYISVGKIDEAGKLITDARQRYPGNEKVLLGSARLSIARGDFKDAITILTGLLAVEKGNEVYLRTLARAQSESSNPSGAIDTYSRLIGLEITDPELFLLRAECLTRTGETGRAMNDIRKYLALFPGNKRALSMAGKNESLSGNNLMALEYFSENLRLHPGDVECYIDRANAYSLSRDWDRAIRDYSMALDVDPLNPEAWFGKGMALARQGKNEDACHDFKESLRLGNKKAPVYINRYCIE